MAEVSNKAIDSWGRVSGAHLFSARCTFEGKVEGQHLGSSVTHCELVHILRQRDDIYPSGLAVIS